MPSLCLLTPSLSLSTRGYSATLCSSCFPLLSRKQKACLSRWLPIGKALRTSALHLCQKVYQRSHGHHQCGSRCPIPWRDSAKSIGARRSLVGNLENVLFPPPKSPPLLLPSQVKDTVVEPLEGVQASEPRDQTPSSSGKSNAIHAEDTLQRVEIRGEWFTVPEADIQCANG